mmetsp:Transcript_146426/g.469805  ORF Transcript_146426/g.469805 Transcript_146426/m.469805 type:complete len:94 (-) Transcript_146426:4-285(-)
MYERVQTQFPSQKSPNSSDQHLQERGGHAAETQGHQGRGFAGPRWPDAGAENLHTLEAKGHQEEQSREARVERGVREVQAEATSDAKNTDARH